MIPLARALNDPDGEERNVDFLCGRRGKDSSTFLPNVEYSRGGGYSPVIPSRFIRELTLSTCDDAEDTAPYERWYVDE
jgi:hypothetical protein